MPVGGPHRENWPALHVYVILRGWLCVVRSGEIGGSLVRVSRSRAMPVGGPHRENWPALQRWRVAMPQGELAGAPWRGVGVIGAGGSCAIRSGRRLVGRWCGFRAPRDAGRRPPPGELAGAPCGIGGGVGSLVRVSRSRAMPVGDRRSKAVRHPALEGFARGAAFSQQGWCGTHVGGGRRYWCGFRAHARCRSEAPTGRTGQRSMWDWRGA